MTKRERLTSEHVGRVSDHTPTPKNIMDLADVTDGKIIDANPCNCGEFEGLHTRRYGRRGEEFARCEKVTTKDFEFIVRAVNAHDELVDLAHSLLVNASRLSELVSAIQRPTFAPDAESIEWIKSEADRAVEDAKQAIAKAEGK